MKNLRNTVRLIGNVGVDPEVKTMSSGKVMAKFPLATTEAYTNKQGDRVFDTTWHNIIAWGSTANLVEKICKKGYKIAVEGKIKNRSYEGQNGEKKYITEIVANELMIISDKSKAENSAEKPEKKVEAESKA